jgi:hypothetical protein
MSAGLGRRDVVGVKSSILGREIVGLEQFTKAISLAPIHFRANEPNQTPSSRHGNISHGLEQVL